MKKAFLFVTLMLICCYGLIAQPTYFNNTYHEAGTNMGSMAAKPLQSGGYIVTGDLNAVDDYSAFYAQKLDEFGNDQWLLHLYGGEFFGVMAFGNSMIASNDGNFLLVGSVGSNETDTEPLLIKFNEEGDTLWTNIYGDSEAEGHLQLIKTKDGYLMVGWAQQYYGPSQFDPSFVRARKIDEAGVVQWTGEYGGNVVVLYAEQTNDGGYILSGYRHAPASGYDMYVVKTDSLGTLQWEQTYGTDEHDGGCRAQQYNDSLYVLVGVIDAGLGNDYYYAMLDVEGNVLWDRQHSWQLHNGPATPLIVQKSGDMVGLISSFSPNPSSPRFIKLSPAGDILWEIPITAHTSGEEYIRDIESTPDGGFVLAGFTYSTPQMSWVVKVDSLGRTCSYIGCDSTAITSITPQAPDVEAEPILTIFPNPARDVTQLHYSLPPNEAFAVLELYDQSGKKVSHRILPAHTNKAQVDVSGLPGGVYLYSLITAGKILATGKLAVY